MRLFYLYFFYFHLYFLYLFLINTNSTIFCSHQRGNISCEGKMFFLVRLKYFAREVITFFSWTKNILLPNLEYVLVPLEDVLEHYSPGPRKRKKKIRWYPWRLESGTDVATTCMFSHIRSVCLYCSGVHLCRRTILWRWNRYIIYLLYIIPD